MPKCSSPGAIELRKLTSLPPETGARCERPFLMQRGRCVAILEPRRIVRRRSRVARRITARTVKQHLYSIISLREHLRVYYLLLSARHPQTEIAAQHRIDVSGIERLFQECRGARRPRPLSKLLVICRQHEHDLNFGIPMLDCYESL